MVRPTYEYRTESFDHPPTADELEIYAGQGWRLLSVTVDVHRDALGSSRFIAYLERPRAVTDADARTAEHFSMKTLAMPANMTSSIPA